MMDDKVRILIIDDEPCVCEGLETLLSGDFICQSAYNGEQGRACMASFSPQVILVDINMPGMNGYELCRKLKARDDASKFAVFIMSADDSTEARLKAYDAGGDDFVCKLAGFEELTRRVRLVARFIKQRLALSADEEASRELAMTSMTQASQYSQVMNFFKTLYHCTSEEQVVRAFFEVMQFFALQASIMLRLEGHRFYDPVHPNISPIEQNIYELLCSQSRLYAFGHRLMVNDKHVSFLIRNMPDDDEKAGQIRDYVASLIEGIESKLLDLQRQNGLAKLSEQVSSTLSYVSKGITKHEEHVNGIMAWMSNEIAVSYHSLELSEEQETFFNDLLKQGGDHLRRSDKLLTDIQQQLADLQTQISMLVEHTKENNSKQDELPESHDIDLF